MGIECCRCPTSLILLMSFLLFPLFTQSLPVRSTRQYLPPIPGYVPVYIQDGETPPDVESIVYEKKTNDPVKLSDSEDIVNPSLKSVEARNIDDELKRSEEEIVRQLTMQQARFFPPSREKRMNKYSSNHNVNSPHNSIKVPS